MGQPEHYSLDLPARCLRLLDELQPCASGIFMPGQDEGLGPLTATFALTMAVPIVTLPFERIFKPDDNNFHYADDRQLKAGLTRAVRTQINLPKFSKASFFGPGVWSFTQVDQSGLFNLADGLPPDVAQQLSKKETFEAAADMPVSQWLGCLRNALAHGGIAYLDQQGMTSEGQPVKMFAFVSGRYKRESRPPELIGLNILRISQADFHRFLRDWVRWLEQSGIDFKAAA